MAEPALSYDDVTGVYGIMPTPSIPAADDPDREFTVDLAEAERGANALVDDDIDAIMINGTFGEAATLTTTEWRAFTKTVVRAVDGRIPVVAGPTTLNTRTTIERARFARDVGADGLLLGQPMWCELGSEATLQFFRDVAEAVPELGIVLYYNKDAFKCDYSLTLWDQLADVPQIVASKFGNFGEEYRDVVDTVGGRIRVLPIDKRWHTANQWYPDEALACWTGCAACDPAPLVALRDAILGGDEAAAERLTERMLNASETFFPEGDRDLFPPYTIPLEKARIDAAGYMTAGPPRPPYHVIPDAYDEGARKAGRRWADLAAEME